MTAIRYDFVERLPPDMSKNILMHLDDPKDLVRASVVSRIWRRSVISSGLSKNLFTRTYPETSNFLVVSEENHSTEFGHSHETTGNSWEHLVKEHEVYSWFLQVLNAPVSLRNCIANSIAASSTDNFPEESIVNTLEANERVNRRPSYWSSDGKKDPSVPETLTYRLCSSLCIVEQINIRPFQAYFQTGSPIYSSKYLRFRMGHQLLPDEADDGDRHGTDEYLWTYVSPTFPMDQSNVLQSFKLPKPVLCIGGIIQIELLGRMQKQEMDGLYYICVCHIQVVGRPVSPAFDIEFIDASKQFVLKKSLGESVGESSGLPSDGAPSGQNDTEIAGSSGWHSFAERIRQLRTGGRMWNEVFLSTLLGTGAIDVDDGDDEDDFMDEDDEDGEDYILEAEEQFR